MKITMIHGQNHVGTTATAGRMLAEKLGGELTEFFLPRDFSDFCVGCAQCFMVSETKCPSYEKLRPIMQAIHEADVLIFTSPVYVYHVTGPMKSFLDHTGYLWMVHRPDPAAFQKQAVLITSAAGAGCRSALKDLRDSMFFWGIGKTYSLGFTVHASVKRNVSEKSWDKIRKETGRTAEKVLKNAGHVRPSLKTRAFFFLMKFLHRKGVLSPNDDRYWADHGWI